MPAQTGKAKGRASKRKNSSSAGEPPKTYSRRGGQQQTQTRGGAAAKKLLLSDEMATFSSASNAGKQQVQSLQQHHLLQQQQVRCTENGFSQSFEKPFKTWNEVFFKQYCCKMYSPSHPSLWMSFCKKKTLEIWKNFSIKNVDEINFQDGGGQMNVPVSGISFVTSGGQTHHVTSANHHIDLQHGEQHFYSINRNHFSWLPSK